MASTPTPGTLLRATTLTSLIDPQNRYHHVAEVEAGSVVEVVRGCRAGIIVAGKGIGTPACIPRHRHGIAEWEPVAGAGTPVAVRVLCPVCSGRGALPRGGPCPNPECNAQ